MIRFRRPSEYREYTLPEGACLVGENHIVKGNATVVAGAPGVGKSRAMTYLAVAGSIGQPWFGMPVHRKFKTLIVQNENGPVRLHNDYVVLGPEIPDDAILVSEPPPFGMAFGRKEFCDELVKAIREFKPDVVVIDPWNSVAADDTQQDYLLTIRQIRSVLPPGEGAPALVIVAHTRKPKAETPKGGIELMHEIAGSHVLASFPRSVFVMRRASGRPEDDRIVWICCKNNDGELGSPSAWRPSQGIFVPVETDLEELLVGSGQRRVVNERDVQSTLATPRSRKDAVEALMKATGLGQSACYQALAADGKLGKNLMEKDGLLHWKSGE
ncbi:MAG: AAA family ATPase [Verrucomicrobia bacterium]|nr:AAA family ATPase [Verrucomicrobiota bacterium]